MIERMCIDLELLAEDCFVDNFHGQAQFYLDVADKLIYGHEPKQPTIVTTYSFVSPDLRPWAPGDINNLKSTFHDGKLVSAEVIKEKE